VKARLLFIAMTQSVSASRAPRSVWVFATAAVLFFAAAGWLWREQTRKGGDHAAAHVIALDTKSKIGFGVFAKPLETSRTFSPGRVIRIPAGSRVRIAFADGRIEDVGGPAKIPVAATESRGEIKDNFLHVPLTELVTLEPTVSHATVGDVSILSPVGVTRFTNPVVTWATRPGAEYDVVIVDPADPMAPPRLLEKIRPPIAFGQLRSPSKRNLQADRLYEVHVRETGSDLMVGLARFLVSKDAAEGDLSTEPADLLREAVDAMTKKPTRTGDAWLALSGLPTAWSESELALRLRLRVTMELGLMDEFVRAQEIVWRNIKK
jgi:hypothetical protein